MNRSYPLDDVILSYGHVCEAIRGHDGHRCALKKVDAIFDNIIDAKRFLREITVLRILRGHEAVVDLYDILVPSDLVNFNSLYFILFL